MAAGPRPEGRPPRRKMFLPPPVPAEIVQPPQRMADLTGDALYEALTTDRSERWYSTRAAAECGRTPDTFRSWVSTRYGYDEAVKKARAEAEKTGGRPKPVRRPTKKMVPPPDGYEVRSPWWWPGTLRRWYIEEKLMDRATGRLIPYKPTGRTPGSVNTVRRKTPRPMQDQALAVLEAVEAAKAGGASIAEAHQAAAARFNLSLKQVERRVLAGRKARNEAADLRVLPGMSAAEVTDRVLRAHQLLAADGRRRNKTRIRYAIADRLGVAESVVDEVLDNQPAEAVAVGT